jgi:hypothetical protein
MQSVFIVTNGGLEQTNNFAHLFRTKEEAINYAQLLRINIKYNLYEIDAPEREELISIMFTHSDKKKTAQYVSSQEECFRLISSYHKEKYDKYFEDSLANKICDYRHTRVNSTLIFQPNCTILQVFGEERGQLSFSCISGIGYDV